MGSSILAKQKSMRDTKPAVGSDDLRLQTAQFLGADIEQRAAAAAGALSLVHKQTATADLKSELKLADYYSTVGSELIQAICKTKRTFFSAGFQVQINKVEKSNSDAMNKRMAEFSQRHDIKQVAKDLIGDLVATDNTILTWRILGNDVEYILAVAPYRAQFLNANGQEVLRIDLSDEVRNDINIYIQGGGTPKGKKDIKTGNLLPPPYPEKYFDAVREGKPVELLNKDGEYWIVKTSGRKYSGLCRPSMRSVFHDILLRELLISGDWSVSFFIQNLIQQVSVGESPPQSGPRAGIQNYPFRDAIEQLKAQFKGPSKSMRLYTDHTTKLQVVFPDPEVFHPAKYQKVDERIFRWGGVLDVLMTGLGDGFAQSYLGKNRFEAEGRETREAISWMFAQFFLHNETRAALQLSNKVEVITTWDEQNLKEWRQVHDSMRMLLDYGFGDSQTVHDRLGENHSLWLQRKQNDMKLEDETPGMLKPLFEPRQGLLPRPDGNTQISPQGVDGKAGRPSQGSTPASPRQPRPSRG